jgi:hypothetical protein
MYINAMHGHANDAMKLNQQNSQSYLTIQQAEMLTTK